MKTAFRSNMPHFSANRGRWLVLCLFAGCALNIFAGEVRLAAPTDPSADATPLIRAALDRVRAEGATRLVLEPGVYQLYPLQAEERFTYVSNHDPGLRRAGFSVQGFRDLEIDGTGVQLVMHGQAFIPFMLNQSERITLRGFTIDWNRPLFLQGKVTAVNTNDDSFDIETLPECGARIMGGQLVYGDDAGWVKDRSPLHMTWQTTEGQVWFQDYQWNAWVDATNGRSLGRETQPKLRPYNTKSKRAAVFEALGENKFRLRYAATFLPKVGNVLICKGEILPNRSTPAIHVARCRDVVLEDMTVHHAGAMGFIAEESENVTLRRYHVNRPPGSARLVSTTADGSHFNMCRGQILVEDCEYGNMMDDAINVHGVYAEVTGLTAPKTIGIQLCHFQQLGLEYARPGDRLRFSAQDTMLGYGERTVAGVRHINGSYLEVTFTESLEGFLKPDSCVDNLACQPDLTFRRNWIHDNRARGVLASTEGRVRIEDNHFDHSMDSSIFLAGDCDFWHESGPVRDVLIRHNKFEMNEAKPPCIKILPQKSGTSLPYHANIRIEENTFILPGSLLVEANRVSGLQVVSNAVSAAANAVAGASPVAFDLSACRDIRIEHNQFRLANPVTVRQKQPVEGLAVKDNNGLVFP